MNTNIIKRVYTKNNYILICEFENKVKKKYNVEKLVKKYSIFKKLEDKNLFKSVVVDKGGYGISWNEEIDLAAEEIWENGEDVCPEDLYYNSRPIK